MVRWKAVDRGFINGTLVKFTLLLASYVRPYLHIFADKVGGGDLPVHDLAVGFHGLVSHEGRVPVTHLVHEHT